MMKIMPKPKVLLILAILGILGGILFCPIKMESGGTCLFQKFFGNNQEQIADHISVMERNHIMLRHYLVPFGFAWWFSLAILALSIYQLKKTTIKSKREPV